MAVDGNLTIDDGTSREPIGLCNIGARGLNQEDDILLRVRGHDWREREQAVALGDAGTCLGDSVVSMELRLVFGMVVGRTRNDGTGDDVEVR